MTTIEKIRAEIDEQTEIHSDGEFYIKNIDVKRILAKYAEQEPCEDCDYSEIMDWEQDAKTGKAKPIYWCERHKEPCDDAVSRQYLIDIATKDGAYDYVSAQEITNAPSVRPQEQTGKWEFVCQHWRKCSECGFSHKFSEDWEYCPNCGAKMNEDNSN